MKGDYPIPMVSVIGTCRVHDPLRNLEERGLIHLNNGGLGSFVHSTPEIVKRLRVMLGLETYDEELLPLQVGMKDIQRTGPEVGYDFQKSDVLVVEVSTIKAISFDNHPMQLNEVARHMCTPYQDFGKALRDNINQAFNNRMEFVPLPSISIPPEYPEKFSSMLDKLKPVVMDNELIFSDLNEIRMLGNLPILFVNHINLPGSNGKLITSRNKCCQILSEYCSQNNIEIFNPIDMFELHQPEDLLMDNGTDLNHYAKDKLNVVGDFQLASILKALGIR